MLAKAAGSEKNIVPKRLIATSKPVGSKRMHLGVAQLVPNVVDSFGRSQLTGALEHALRTSTPTTRPARLRAPPRELSVRFRIRCRLPRHRGWIPQGRAKVPVVAAKLRVVEVQAGRRGHRRDARDRGLTTIDVVSGYTPPTPVEAFLDPDDPVLFPHLTADQIEELAKHGETLSMSPGEVVFEQAQRDTPSSSSGAIDVIDRQPDGDHYYPVPTGDLRRRHLHVHRRADARPRRHRRGEFDSRLAPG